ncbi:hypothetical protein Pla52n_53600 [Stieleria varia]|uniref:Uncharacterized protein n=1 Tax=Stieleria varia TaxID=2528005 RepID=A0A5C6A583_9BACT|nr:hypothetical protein Pla52n_53580 [Stieleria varia]TWT94539.1 hypothetical protein Pla52n_53600 [Stieleria varia]
MTRLVGVEVFGPTEATIARVMARTIRRCFLIARGDGALGPLRRQSALSPIASRRAERRHAESPS